MRTDTKFAQLFGGVPLRTTLVAANAATKLLMETLLPSDARQVFCSNQDERKLLDRLVREIEGASGKKADCLGCKQRTHFIASLDRALTNTTRKTIRTERYRAKRGLANIRKISVDLA